MVRRGDHKHQAQATGSEFVLVGQYIALGIPGIVFASVGRCRMHLHVQSTELSEKRDTREIWCKMLDPMM